MMEKFKPPTPCLIFFIVVLSFTILTTSGMAEATTNHKEAPQTEGNNAPLPDSLPSGTPINNVPFTKPVGISGKQSQLGYQQQQGPSYQQQGINQPLSGFSQPFSSTNQPFGGTEQDVSRDYAAFDNGVPKEKICIQGVALVCLLALMVCFGF
ncbi:hypothetical protein V6N13_058947 [Hibiscus sabdariffa]|uniref:Transmembrane protein n=2 Tax=Hibiscus sabdariffa TaxID=183260 RepID=A0ABR2GGE1_9ROSI